MSHFATTRSLFASLFLFQNVNVSEQTMVDVEGGSLISHLKLTLSPAYWTKRQGKGIPDPTFATGTSVADSKNALPSSSSTEATTSLKPEGPAQLSQPQQPQSDSNDPPPPYSSALSEGWEILPRYREEEEEERPGSRS